MSMLFLAMLANSVILLVLFFGTQIRQTAGDVAVPAHRLFASNYLTGASEMVPVYFQPPKGLNCATAQSIGKMAVGVSEIAKMETDDAQKCVEMCWLLRPMGCYSVNFYKRSSSCSFLNFYAPNPFADEHLETHPGFLFIEVQHCSGPPIVTSPSPSIPPSISPVNPLNPECGIPKVQPHMNNKDVIIGRYRIVNGTEATPHSLPWQVALLRTGSFICGGVLVDAVTVITAAHCVSIDSGETVMPIDAREFSVEIGIHNMNENEGVQRRGVKALKVYHEFNFEKSIGDMAILHLLSPITFTNDVLPICLPSSTQDVFTGEKCIVAGWGLTSESGSKSDVLMQLVVPVLDSKLCTSNQSYGPEVIPEFMICAGYMEGMRDACQGDSGGPLVCRKNGRWFTQGVVSFGSGCARKNKPGVFTRLARFRAWITQTMQEFSVLS